MDQEECPHCGKWLSRRQVNRHLMVVGCDFNLSSSDAEMSDDGDADAEMSDDSDTDASDVPIIANAPVAVNVPGAINHPGAADDLGAADNTGFGSEHDDEGTYIFYAQVTC
jgi:hypothetical protein